ncbi:hypothetical protein VMT65_29590 [Nocardia sp. CDC153]|uniref:hypothetical protein n=1 Tax=Nocardia sp. CDC153 TaxID=3112167 RepID=UPI002DB7D0DF|nr:hypothetical protein [Nocardia sp. CDC153]MEC3957219.1 hypothetical protein [Nocardia sp. CDC153]
MRVRTIAASATAVTGLALAGLFATGTASAATPYVIPQLGAAGLALSPGETQSLASSPVPALVDRFAPRDFVTVGMEPDSTLPQDDTGVYADMPAIIGEAAAHPNGTVDVVWVDGGLVVLQDW